MAFIHDDQPQEVYDGFNKFIFSGDRKLFGKLLSKIEFCEKTKDIPGDIVELGVFKGSGILSWLKTLETVNLNHKSVVGFDFFDSKETVDSIQSIDKKIMESLFADRNFDPSGYDIILTAMLTEARYRNFELIKGNVMSTVQDYLKKYPGFRASIVNFDLDVDEPTYVCMELLWERLVPGGYYILDEYALKQWTESDAVDRFCKKYNTQVKSTKYFAPSGYIQKCA